MLPVGSAVANWPRIEKRPYGFFAYNLADWGGPAARAVEIHIANPFAPASAFADPQQRRRELRHLLSDAKNAHPDATHLATGTWLNAFPPFLAFFPPEWAASAHPVTTASWGGGHWGQFYTRRGGFHRQNGEHLRRTGELRYPPLHCHCRLDTVIAHLDEAMAAAQNE